MTLADFLTASARMVDDAIGTWIKASPSSYVEVLFAAMNYSVNAGGKRLRPGLLLMTGDALGVTGDQLLPAAAAIEMIHTYSLIHDDLPAMDNDDLRRGKPTNHKVYGEAIALLAGDALLTLAFQVLAESRLPGSIVVAMIRELARAAGPFGMVGGQTADILEEGKPVEESLVEYIHMHKTGALIQAAVLMPAYAAAVNADTMRWLSTYAEAIGLAFQIVDDILDEVGNTEQLGKPAGADAKLQKATYPALFGIEASRQRVAALTDQALEAISRIKEFKRSSSLLIELAVSLRDRDR